jgi:hypothetical protein
MRRVWVVLKNDGTTVICDTKEDMNAYANLSSTQKLEGSYTMSEKCIQNEKEYADWMNTFRGKTNDR